MATRGKRSAAALSVVAPLNPGRRPDPPADLTGDQADLWRAIVERLPGGWIEREHDELLAEYVRHCCRARFLSVAVDSFGLPDLSADGGVKLYGDLAAAAEREGRAMLACARALRLTHQARMEPRTAARRAAETRDGPPPWEW